MAYRVVLTDKAEADVDAVLRWLCDQRASDAAGRWYASLRKTLDKLENRPERCPIAPESPIVGREVRELLLGRRRTRYRILFEVQGRSVVILRIWHASRDAPTPDDLSK